MFTTQLQVTGHPISIDVPAFFGGHFTCTNNVISSLIVPAVLREKPRTRAGRGTPIPDEIPRENCSELITTPTVQPVEATADKAENSTPQPVETLANMVAKSVSPQPMQVQVVVITTPTAQPVETVDDAVMAMGSLQLEDNPVEESETASSSLSPDSSPVGGVRQNSSSSPDKVEPAENIKGGSMSTESSSGEAESSDKEAEVGFSRLVFVSLSTSKECFPHLFATQLLGISKDSGVVA